MTISTPINKDRLKTHMTYNGWKYLLLVALSIMVWSLIYTQTAYRSPQDKRIDVYIQSATASSDATNSFLEPLWKQLVPEMETVNSVILTPDETYGMIQLQVYLAAGEGDIYFLSLEDFKSFASQGSFVALDDYVKDGIINVEDINLNKGYVTVVDEYDSDGNAIYDSTGSHLYGIPTESLYGFMNGFTLDNRGMVMCIAVNNENDENVVPFFNALLQAGRGEKPEWLAE